MQGGSWTLGPLLSQYKPRRFQVCKPNLGWRVVDSRKALVLENRIVRPPLFHRYRTTIGIRYRSHDAWLHALRDATWTLLNYILLLYSSGVERS